MGSPDNNGPDRVVGPDPKGGLYINVAVAQGMVTLQFGQTLDWIAMKPNEAKALAELILEKAKLAEGIIQI